MNFDETSHVANLFAIIEGCVSHSGKFSAIQNEAFNDLAEINEHFKEEQMRRKAQSQQEDIPEENGMENEPAKPEDTSATSVDVARRI